MKQESLLWEGHFEPLRLFGNLYFVGNKPASVHIVDTGEGLIMLDTGYQQSLAETVDNIYRMGLDPHEIKYVLLTHGHIDHMGGARTMRAISGAKILLGRADREYANGELDLSYARELDMRYDEVFEPDILLDDGDTLTFGHTTVRAVKTPGHTPGAMSYFFNVTDGERELIAGLHGGMGINTLSAEFLDRYGLPYSLRRDFICSMQRLNQEHVDIFLGNHMQHNRTEEKAKRLAAGEQDAFIDPEEWQKYNLWCIDNLNNMIEEENKA